MKTLKLLITEQCNLNCSYCCNKIKEVRKEFTFIKKQNFERFYLNMNWINQFKNIDITGGEPLLNIEYIKMICSKLAKTHNIYLYTNGLFLNIELINYLFLIGIKGIRIGIHNENKYLLKEESLYLYRYIQFICNEDLKEDNYIKGNSLATSNKFLFYKLNECKLNFTFIVLT
jgi:pyruvate formate-lyase activating enzyme-like uncharacterized protein